jgi:hypothetical protein
MAPLGNRPNFTGSNAFGGTPAPRVFVDEGQPGGREIVTPGILSGEPLNRTPATPPTIGAFNTSISPSVKSALAKGPSERAERVRAVVARKR